VQRLVGDGAVDSTMGPEMMARTDLDRFMVLVRRDNTGTTGWTRGRSSLRFTLDAIEAYNRQSKPSGTSPRLH
jgi:hypothetical protein